MILTLHNHPTATGVILRKGRAAKLVDRDGNTVDVVSEATALDLLGADDVLDLELAG